MRASMSASASVGEMRVGCAAYWVNSSARSGARCSNAGATGRSSRAIVRVLLTDAWQKARSRGLQKPIGASPTADATAPARCQLECHAAAGAVPHDVTSPKTLRAYPRLHLVGQRADRRERAGRRRRSPEAGHVHRPDLELAREHIEDRLEDLPATPDAMQQDQRLTDTPAFEDELHAATLTTQLRAAIPARQHAAAS